MKKRFSFVALAVLVGTVGVVSINHLTSKTPAPYAGQDGRAVKALSADRVAGLMAGKGLGYAKSAELGGWPGPLHVLELDAELQLSASQRSQMQRLRQEMLERAKPLGVALIDAEKRLDALFAQSGPTATEVEDATQQIALLEGRLRAVHLTTHLKTAPLLNNDQKTIYQKARGYADGNHAGHSGH